jgi:hypothetical protein
MDNLRDDPEEKKVELGESRCALAADDSGVPMLDIMSIVRSSLRAMDPRAG